MMKAGGFKLQDIHVMRQNPLCCQGLFFKNASCSMFMLNECPQIVSYFNKYELSVNPGFPHHTVNICVAYRQQGALSVLTRTAVKIPELLEH